MNTIKNKLSAPLTLAGMGLVGLLVGIGAIASAQSATTSSPATVTTTSSSNTTQNTVDKPESANDPTDGKTGSAGHHAPLGGDGVVSSINSSTIVMAEESNEGSASYTVDASKATVTSDGTSASLSDIKVGDKVFVKGAVSGTNVAATSISLDHQETGNHQDANDTGSANDSTDTASSSDATGQ